MQWLVGYACPCDAEAAAWESLVRAHGDADWALPDLAGLRDPAALGRILREDPERFSQLSQQSTLRAWLRFADDKTLREQALAGARALPHRNEDAMKIWAGDEFAKWDLLIYLPFLDLDATPELCNAALGEAHSELARIYRPTPDNPLPYRDFLSRLGTGEPVRALIWLARHGCDAAVVVDEAESLIGAYEDSPTAPRCCRPCPGCMRRNERLGWNLSRSLTIFPQMVGAANQCASR